MEIYTSHWRSPLLEDVDAVIVSISRGQPRWRLPFKYRKLPALAPGDEAWNAEDQEGFERIYIEQLEELGVERILADLRRVAGDCAAVLVCWERPGDEFCHRWMLSRWLEEQAGIVVPELEHAMLEKRPDTPQPPLFGSKEDA